MSLGLSALGRARDKQAQARDVPLSTRLGWVRSLSEHVLRDRETLIDRLQTETGKSRSDALMSEIFPILEYLQFIRKESPKRLRDEKVPTPLALLGKQSWIYYEPYGVILVISPWNYPLFQALAPIMTALVCGNTVVYKPSEYTPLEGLVESLLQAAGVPEGFVEVVYGDGAVGKSLIAAHPDKIFFTGSGATGKKILAQAAELLIPVELELGGKDAMIVFGDVNLDRAVSGALWGGLTNCGQACTGVERILIERSIVEAFTERLIERAKEITQEVDREGDAEIGRMTLPSQVAIVKDHLADAIAKGAVQQTGKHWDGVQSFIPPIVLTGVKDGMKALEDETFGPILPVQAFDSEEEAVRIANSSRYGLTASVWSKDLDRAKRVARKLHVGGVSINNVMLTEGNSHLPFGGVKESGIGRYKGAIGFLSFAQAKAILVDKDSKKIEANWYPYTKKKYSLFSRMMEGLFTGGWKGMLRFAWAGFQLESLSQKRKRDAL